MIDTGEPIAGLEVDGADAGRRPGDRTHLARGFYPVRGGDGEILGLGAAIVDITERKAAEAERERALAAEREARAAAEAAATRARFLAEASVLLDRSLDYDETLDSVAALAVPDIADWCAVDALEQRRAAQRRGQARRPGQGRARPSGCSASTRRRRTRPTDC